MLFHGTLLLFDLLEEKIGGLEIGLRIPLDLTLYCVPLDKDLGAKQTPAIVGRDTLTTYLTTLTQTTLRVGERYCPLHALECSSA